jgi:hypothetical protein
MITELIQRQQPGFSLEQAFYTDPAIFELDLAQVFAAHWQYVGHISRIPNPGAYFLYQFGRESLIITRAEDGGFMRCSTSAGIVARASVWRRAARSKSWSAPIMPGSMHPTAA